MLAMSAGAASAYAKPLATTACGAACTDVSFVNPGPTDLLGTHSGLALPNNVVQLVAGSDTAYQEDFTQNDVGTVSRSIARLPGRPRRARYSPTTSATCSPRLACSGRPHTSGRTTRTTAATRPCASAVGTTRCPMGGSCTWSRAASRPTPC
jgi:hypothetical protein